MAFISLNDVVNNHHRCRPFRPDPAADLSRQVSEVSSLPNCAGTVGFIKAVDLLDILGIGMTNLNLSSGFVTGMNIKGTKISLLAFEVANTVVKGKNLMQCLGKENIKHLKEYVLPSEGVQCLVSRDMDELLKIAASDIREELKIFTRDVARFGNLCKDPQWHNLDRYCYKLGSELIPQRQLKEEPLTVMQQLLLLVQHTADLYHELHTLDKFEQEYMLKFQDEENSTTPHRGESLAVLRKKLKSQRKHVRNIKKKSLWFKNIEGIIEKLVRIVHFLYLEFYNAFGTEDSGDKPESSFQRLGPAGLALHYANIISQIDTLVSCSSSVPPNKRDRLYQALPPIIKSSLQSKLRSFQVKEELTIPQIKMEMEKTLQWLVPIATNTTKAHPGFGWVAEWANMGCEVHKKPSGQNDTIKIETLHHADKEKTEAYILELVICLHLLVSQSKSNVGIKSSSKSPIHVPNQKLTVSRPPDKLNTRSSILTLEDGEMMWDVNFGKLTPGISRHQEFHTATMRLTNHHRLNKSSSYFPTNGIMREAFSTRRLSVPVIDFDVDEVKKALDVIDGVDTQKFVKQSQDKA